MNEENTQEARSSSLFSIGASLAQLDYDRVTRMVALEAKTGRGRQLVSGLTPTTHIGVAERRQKRLAEMRSLISKTGLLPFTGLESIPSEDDLEEGGLAEAWRVLRAAKGSAALREAVLRSEIEIPELADLANEIPVLDELIGSIARYFDRDGRLREDATPELKKLRGQVLSRRREAQKTLQRVIGENASSVQDELVTQRSDRYCIPVRADRRNAIPGILHQRSGSGASVYIEPLEVVELNNDIAALTHAEQEEIRRIEALIMSQIRSWSREIEKAVVTSGKLDAIQACAIVGNLISATRPRFSAGGELRILAARHPLLDRATASLRESAFGESDEMDVVPTTIEIERERPGLVISGPNAGGKTVALKTAGLLTAMAAAGLPVPASDGTTLPVPDSIFILIGDDQDVLGHLSTFSGYLTRLRQVLESATDRSLVLLDELGSGTDPDEGSALAVAVVEHLLDTGCLFILTTHLGRVQSFAIAEERIVNASMEFEETGHVPTFRLVRDLPGRSRALEVARRVGLPRAVLDRAREIVGDASAAADELLTQLQRTIESNRAVTRELETRVESLNTKERELTALEENLRGKQKHLAKEWRRESDELRREVRQRLREEIEILRQKGRESVDKSLLPTLSRSILEKSDERTSRVELDPGSAERVVEGGGARHATLGFEGTVASIDGDKVELIVRGKRMKTRLEELEPLEKKPAAKSEAPRSRTKGETEPAPDREQAVELELNLIGQRVEEALDASESFIDQALRDGKRTVRIIHGHGTGRLRDAVRDWLRSHPAVANHRAGAPREGGNGATIANLR